MPYLIGIILGDVLARIGLFRAAGAAVVLAASGYLAYHLVAANLDPGYAYAAAAAAPLALFGWAVWNPAASRFRLWIVDGVYLAARLSMWWAAIAFAFGLAAAGFRVDRWLTAEWPQAATAGVFWAVQWVLGVQTARSHRIMGDRSVVEA
ncbi:hypothetical protein [Sphingomonas sp. PP-CC-3G-468]|uniref:hypothetical protein n=1 Tax=Sphingomonas sp. PP-CC-3G-468 TaxID=2135656 RepID=UPI00104C1906|nr:hypothetical protein [Sphingomonas sp. PP-CC-3G-468]TCM07373.1 hypothetical protein C8J41_103281 [Sphingomonas sp. PP-CC-3G-468]